MQVDRLFRHVDTHRVRQEDHGRASFVRLLMSRPTHSAEVAWLSRISIRTPTADTTTAAPPSSPVDNAGFTRTETGRSVAPGARARGPTGRRAARGSLNRARHFINRRAWMPCPRANATIFSPLAAHHPITHRPSSALHRRGSAAPNARLL